MKNYTPEELKVWKELFKQGLIKKGNFIKYNGEGITEIIITKDNYKQYEGEKIQLDEPTSKHNAEGMKENGIDRVCLNITQGAGLIEYDDHTTDTFKF